MDSAYERRRYTCDGRLSLAEPMLPRMIPVIYLIYIHSRTCSWRYRLVHAKNMSSYTLRPKQNGRYFAEKKTSAFLLIKMFGFRFSFSRKSVRTQTSVTQHWFRTSGSGLAPNRRQAITQSNKCPQFTYIRASPGDWPQWHMSLCKYSSYSCRRVLHTHIVLYIYIYG